MTKFRESVDMCPDLQVDCQFALASFSSSSYCSSIGTLVLQKGSRIHKVSWEEYCTGRGRHG